MLLLVCMMALITACGGSSSSPPEPTPVSIPTDTPAPTNTYTPDPTNTPIPTDTPNPTDTPFSAEDNPINTDDLRAYAYLFQWAECEDSGTTFTCTSETGMSKMEYSEEDYIYLQYSYENPDGWNADAYLSYVANVAGMLGAFKDKPTSDEIYNWVDTTFYNGESGETLINGITVQFDFRPTGADLYICPFGCNS